MGFSPFSTPKGSIKQTVNAKVKAGQPHGTGAATKVQRRQAKERSKQIKEEKARRKQEAADLRRYNMLRTPTAKPGKQAKNKQKAIAAGEKRRAKQEARRAARRARRR